MRFPLGDAAMPIYVFSCPQCGLEDEIEFETEQEASDARKDAWCERCDREMKITDSHD
jgi:predicted nucleic acid-binding Zn ribbon protein